MLRTLLIVLALVLASAPAARAACFNPAGSAGNVIYNADYTVMQYCNGGAWVRIGPVGNTVRGLAGWWKFDEGAGTSAGDSSGNGNTGTLTNGPIWTTGIYNGALKLDAANKYVAMASASSLNLSTFSISAWVNFTAVIPGWDTIVEKAVNATSDNYYILYHNTGLDCGFTTAGTFHSHFAAWTPSTGQWYHVSCTYDGTQVVVYVNGAQIGSNPETNTPDVSTGTLDIGISPYNNLTNYFSGTVDDVRVYNRALSAADVSALYANVPPHLRGSYATPSNAYAVWDDGAYIYVADNTSLEAFTFNGATFTLKGSIATTAAGAVWGDGTYIYVADGAGGVKAFTFNGTTFTLKGSYALANATSVWGDGAYIYAADWGNGIKAFTFNGTTFTFKGSYATAAPGNVGNIWTDGTYIYTADWDADDLEALTFNGTAFTLKGSWASGGGYVGDVWGDGRYIYATTGALWALTFNGTTFTVITGIATPGEGHGVWGDGTYIYVTGENNFVQAYSFNGAAFTPAGSYATTDWGLFCLGRRHLRLCCGRQRGSAGFQARRRLRRPGR